MIIDCREWPDDTERMERERSRVFVDGVEIEGVWYLDTQLGVVKTLLLGPDLLGVLFIRFCRQDYPADWEFEMREDGAMTRIIRGVVTLEPLANT